MNRIAPSSHRRSLVIGSLTLGHALSFSIILMIGLLMPDVAEDLSLSPSQQGWLGASATLSVLFLAIPTNAMSTRYRPWRVATLGLLAVSGFTFLQGAAPNFALLLAGRLGMALAFSQTEAATALLVQQWSTRRQLAPTNGMMISGGDVGIGVAFLLPPFLIDWVGGWRNTMYLWASISLFGAFVWMIFGEERMTDDYRDRLSSQTHNPLTSILKYKELWLLGLAMFGGIAVENAFSVFWPTFAELNMGVDTRIIGLGMGLYMLSAAPAELLVVYLPFFQKRRLTVIVVTGVVTILSHLALLFISSSVSIVLISILRGLSISYFPVIVTLVYQLPNIKPREVAVGLAFIYTVI